MQCFLVSAIENEFYGSKLRVNGVKSTKKAQQVRYRIYSRMKIFKIQYNYECFKTVN